MPQVSGSGSLPVAPALSPAELRARVEAILAAGDYQRALPRDPTPPKPFDLPLGPLELLLRLLLWTALAVMVVLALSWLVRRLSAGARDVEVAEPAAPPPPEIHVESAEALAAMGRFAEAIHALLLETLAALSRASRLAPSLTSREILARVRLAPPAREALVGLVEAVEISRFGGATAAEGDYRACLARFRAFEDATRSAA